MTKRGSTGALIAVLVVLTGLGLAASFVPFRTCGSCHGLAVSWKKLVPNAGPFATLLRADCPDCADRGKVSVLRWWKPRASPRISELLRELRDLHSIRSREILGSMLVEAGMASDAFQDTEMFGGIRFHRSEQDLFLVLLGNYGSHRVQGEKGSRVLLLTPEGRVLDLVQFSAIYKKGTDFHHVFLTASFRDPPGGDGAQVVVATQENLFLNEIGPSFWWELTHWREKPSTGVLIKTPQSNAEGFSRLKVGPGRVDVLSPDTK